MSQVRARSERRPQVKRGPHGANFSSNRIQSQVPYLAGEFGRDEPAAQEAGESLGAYQIGNPHRLAEHLFSLL
jgi:hypothetical protein